MIEDIIRKQVQSLFKAKPSLEKIWVNPKGEFFTNESLAKNSLKKDERLEVVKREVTADVNAKGLIELVKEQNIIFELEQLMLEEIDDKNRKTVIEAIEKRIEELKIIENGKS